jgi:hypothetical protein
MHDCQKFREDWIAGSAETFGDCDPCRDFCEEAGLILRATDGVSQPVPEFPQVYWDRFEDRLHAKLVREHTSRMYRFYWKWGAVAAASLIVVSLTWGRMRLSEAPVNTASVAPQVEFVDDHIRGLNPTVVTFLGHSELFLRSFTKIEPSYKEDLQDAQFQAQEDLAEIEKQKLRAADFVPVRIALDEYENVLRDIKNLNSPEDIKEIQSRIRSTGLIANMKAYQPQVVLVGQR